VREGLERHGVKKFAHALYTTVIGLVNTIYDGGSSVLTDAPTRYIKAPTICELPEVTDADS